MRAAIANYLLERTRFRIHVLPLLAIQLNALLPQIEFCAFMYAPRRSTGEGPKKEHWPIVNLLKLPFSNLLTIRLTRDGSARKSWLALDKVACRPSNSRKKRDPN
jgi:hypothetical protein